jgi:hypothetical protein
MELRIGSPALPLPLLPLLALALVHDGALALALLATRYSRYSLLAATATATSH